MKAALKAKKTYDVTIDGKVYGGMSVVSEWEGFMKLANASGHAVIIKPDNFRFLDEVFGGEISATVIAICPQLSPSA